MPTGVHPKCETGQPLLMPRFCSTVQALVDENGRLPSDEQAAILDALIKAVPRALKCQRKGNSLCMRLEATEAVTYARHVLFAWDGRGKPYPV
jgi:hypothetical protein